MEFHKTTMPLPNKPTIENSPVFPKEQQQEQLRAENVFGMFRTWTAAPTSTDVPTNFLDQIRFVVTTSAINIYFYDVTNKTWRHFMTGDIVNGAGTISVSQTQTQIIISN